MGRRGGCRGRFYTEVFDADVGPTRTHGDDGNETMTVIGIGPHSELNIFVIAGNTEAQRQTPGAGRPGSTCTEIHRFNDR